jgi:hypothetical protein
MSNMIWWVFDQGVVTASHVQKLSPLAMTKLLDHFRIQAIILSVMDMRNWSDESDKPFGPMSFGVLTEFDP